VVGLLDWMILTTLDYTACFQRTGIPYVLIQSVPLDDMQVLAGQVEERTTWLHDRRQKKVIIRCEGLNRIVDEDACLIGCGRPSTIPICMIIRSHGAPS
jgi:hypothetical protein